jgi:macrolide transport system ATP-binding/permease protein
MQAIALFLRKLRILFGRYKFNRDLDEEMAFHREQAQQKLQSDGLPAEAAQHAARTQFGNDTRLKEKSHEIVGFRIESVWQDFRFAIRQLHKNPGFACIAILMLTLGMCASISIFAFVDATLIKPLPYKDPSRLVDLAEYGGFNPRANLSYYDYLDWDKQQHVFSALDAWTGGSFLVRAPEGALPVMASRVGAGFFGTLGVQPILGRDFQPVEGTPQGPRVVILSYSTWQTRFGGRREVVGQTITLDDNPYTIIGVLPREFHFAPRGPSEFWTTFHDLNGCEKERACHNLFGVARLKPGVSIQSAQAELASIAARLEMQYPDSNHGRKAVVTPLSESIVGDIRPILLTLLCGAGLLLLIACLNVSSLLLVRSENRRREMAVRGALGASRARLIRQFVTEGLVLVFAGAALGSAAAYGMMHLLVRLIPKDMMAEMPFFQEIGLNPRVLLFAVLVALFAAVLFSVTPMLRTSVTNLREDLTEGGRGSAGITWRRLGSNLVVVELMIATVLLCGAGLLGKSFYRLLHVELGFAPDHLATLEVAVPGTTYDKDEKLVALRREIVRRIDSLPAVRSSDVSSLLPVSFNGNTTWFRVLGHPYDGEHKQANERKVGTAYFATIKAKLMRGRFFTEGDDQSKSGVIIINQTLAKQYFPGEDPIGQKIGNPSLSPKSMSEIVGVVDDIREGPLDSALWPAIYEPFSQAPIDYFSISVRTSQAEQSILPAVVSTIRSIDPSLGIRNEATMLQHIHDSSTAYLHRSSAWLVSGFAALALLLSAIGLYGVIAYSVSQRTREIGVRMALGAQRSSVYQLILKEATWLIALGTVAGLSGSLAVTTLMGKLLFGVHAWDVPTLAAVALLLGVSALLASYIPARRAASVNPVEALRAE